MRFSTLVLAATAASVDAVKVVTKSTAGGQRQRSWMPRPLSAAMHGAVLMNHAGMAGGNGMELAQPRMTLQALAGNESDKEKFLKDQIQQEFTLIESIQPTLETFTADFLGLKDYGMLLPPLVLGLPAQDRTDIVALLEAKNVHGALKLLIKDTDDLPWEVKALPGCNELIAQLNKIEGDMTTAEHQILAAEVQAKNTKAALDDYVQNDSSSGSLGVLIQEYQTENAVVQGDFQALSGECQTAALAFGQFINTTIKTHSFDQKDWDAFTAAAAKADATAVQAEADESVAAVTGKQVVEKLEELIQPDNNTSKGFMVI